MKQMTKLENIIMNRSGCNRETANIIANDILQEVEKDLQADFAREIFEEIEIHKYPSAFGGYVINAAVLAELKKKYTEGQKMSEYDFNKDDEFWKLALLLLIFAMGDGNMIEEPKNTISNDFGSTDGSTDGSSTNTHTNTNTNTNTDTNTHTDNNDATEEGEPNGQNIKE